MQTYIGTKTIKAEPMRLLCPDLQTKQQDGYKVVYPDGYESWSPKDVFEAAYKLADTWLDRLRIERDELSARLDKLTAFTESPAFNDVPEHDAALLLDQRNAMAGYLEILTVRIERAGQ